MVTSYVRYDEAYGRPSEAERQSVFVEGLINPRMLKIQSDPLGNLWDMQTGVVLPIVHNGQKSHVPYFIVWKLHYVASKSVDLQDILLRETPKAYNTKADCESIGWPRTELGYGSNL